MTLSTLETLAAVGAMAAGSWVYAKSLGVDPERRGPFGERMTNTCWAVVNARMDKHIDLVARLPSRATCRPDKLAVGRKWEDLMRRNSSSELADSVTDDALQVYEDVNLAGGRVFARAGVPEQIERESTWNRLVKQQYVRCSGVLQQSDGEVIVAGATSNSVCHTFATELLRQSVLAALDHPHDSEKDRWDKNTPICVIEDRAARTVGFLGNVPEEVRAALQDRSQHALCPRSPDYQRGVVQSRFEHQGAILLHPRTKDPCMDLAWASLIDAVTESV